MPVGKTYDVPVKSPDRFYIGGEWVTPSSADLIDVIQPATEDVWVRIAAARPADVSRAVAAARQAFDRGPWPRMTHAQRAEYLRAIAAGLRSRAEDLSSRFVLKSPPPEASRSPAYLLAEVSRRRPHPARRCSNMVCTADREVSEGDKRAAAMALAAARVDG